MFIGIFVINYPHGGLAGFKDPGAVYVIVAALLFSVATITGRKYNELLIPGFMSLIRSFVLSLAMLILFLSAGQFQEIPATIWRDMSLGSLLETLIVIVFAYQALKMIEATKTSLIISTKGVWLITWGDPSTRQG